MNRISSRIISTGNELCQIKRNIHAFSLKPKLASFFLRAETAALNNEISAVAKNLGLAIDRRKTFFPVDERPEHLAGEETFEYLIITMSLEVDFETATKIAEEVADIALSPSYTIISLRKRWSFNLKPLLWGGTDTAISNEKKRRLEGGDIKCIKKGL